MNGNFSNPLAGKRAWCQGTVGAMTQVNVNLASFVGSADTKLRWREGDDSSAQATGWYVDSVTVNNAGVASACTSGPPPALDYWALTPCRLVDTRNPNGPMGGPALAASANRTFVLTGACGVPTTAKAVMVNLTVVNPAAAGFLTLYPSNQSAPTASTINFMPGAVRSNNATVGLATDASGGITVKNGSAGTLHFVLDVTGYYE